MASGGQPLSLIPTLAGIDPAVIYKQLDDYRSGKRLWGVMNAIARALRSRTWAESRSISLALQTGYRR